MSLALGWPAAAQTDSARPGTTYPLPFRPEDWPIVPAEISDDHQLVRTMPAVAPSVGAISPMVRLMVYVTDRGEVAGVEVISGHPTLVQAAVNVARKWEFRPFLFAGRAVDARAEVVVALRQTGASPEGARRKQWAAALQQGLAALDTPDFAAAEKAFAEARELAEKLPSDDYLKSGVTLRYLALAQAAQKKAGEAEGSLQALLALIEKRRGASPVHIGEAMCELAQLYAAQGQPDRAAPLVERANALFERAAGQYKDDYLKRMASRFLMRGLGLLASLQEKTGKAAAAEPFYQKALGLAERCQSPRDTLAILEGYAALLRQAGREAEAARFDERARALRAPSL